MSILLLPQGPEALRSEGLVLPLSSCWKSEAHHKDMLKQLREVRAEADQGLQFRKVEGKTRWMLMRSFEENSNSFSTATRGFAKAQGMAVARRQHSGTCEAHFDRAVTLAA